MFALKAAGRRRARRRPGLRADQRRRLLVGRPRQERHCAGGRAGSGQGHDAHMRRQDTGPRRRAWGGPTATAHKAGDAAEFEGLRRSSTSRRPTRIAAGAPELGQIQIGNTSRPPARAGLFKAVMALHHKICRRRSESTGTDPDWPLKPVHFGCGTGRGRGPGAARIRPGVVRLVRFSRRQLPRGAEEYTGPQPARVRAGRGGDFGLLVSRSRLPRGAR